MTPVLAVLRKDLRLAWRDRAAWLSAAAFATLAVLTYSFAFDLATRDVTPLLAGVLWATFLFAGIIAAGQAFQREAEEGTLDAMLLAPVPPTAIYAGKALANLVALLAIEFAVVVLATILFDATLLTPRLALVVLVGTIGYVALTTLLATLGARVRARALLLPVLSLPLLVPLLIAGVRATGASIGGSAAESVGEAPWLLLLVVFAAWSVFGGALLFPMAVRR